MAKCAIDPEVFAIQEAPLYPGKRNFWVIAVDDADLRSELKDAGPETRIKLAQRRLEIFWGSTVMPLIESGSWIGLEAYAVGDKSEFQGTLKKRVRKDLPVNPDWTYIGCEFTYQGTKTLIPWPWRTSLFDSCPEKMREGLWAVYVPAPAAHPEDDWTDTLGHTVDDVAQDAKDVAKGLGNLATLLVGVAVVGFVLNLRKK